MKAFCYERHAGPIALASIPCPPTPARGQVIVRVQAASLNPVDYKQAGGSMAALINFNWPRVVGFDFSGDVVAVGDGVAFRIGERVFGMIRGLPQRDRGTVAEFVLVDADVCAHCPLKYRHPDRTSPPFASLPGMPPVYHDSPSRWPSSPQVDACRVCSRAARCNHCRQGAHRRRLAALRLWGRPAYPRQTARSRHQRSGGLRVDGPRTMVERGRVLRGACLTCHPQLLLLVGLNLCPPSHVAIPTGHAQLSAAGCPQAIQLAKHMFGAQRVVVTASPGAKAQLCTELGADKVYDYRARDCWAVLAHLIYK